MAKSKVAILRTSPATVLRDYHDVMNLAGYQDVIAKDADTALKVNISWHFFFPGSSTVPWQLDGVIRALKADGYDPNLIHACHNRTVVIDAHLGERENKQVNVVEAHGLRNIHLYEGEEWIGIKDAVGDLTKKFLCLNEVYPQRLPDSAALHRREHHPPADGEDARLHDDDRRDEERVRRPAERAAALDPPGHPRDARGPADDPEEDPPRRLRRDGRHLRRRRPRAAVHDAARQERDSGQQRPGGDRRRGGEADGLQPARRSSSSAWRTTPGLGCGDPREIEIVGDVEAGAPELALRRPVQEDDLRVAHAAPDLLGAAQEADRVEPEDRARAVVLHRVRRVPNLAGYQDVIAKDADTALKVNISWHFFFPGSSTVPWQLDGVIRAHEGATATTRT